MSGGLISKSIRLTPQQAAFVDSQEGKDFSDKLRGIIFEYQQGEADRQKNLTYYDDLIAKKKKELQKLNDLGMKLSSFRRDAIFIEASFNRIMDGLKDQ